MIYLFEAYTPAHCSNRGVTISVAGTRSLFDFSSQGEQIVFSCASGTVGDLIMAQSQVNQVTSLFFMCLFQAMEQGVLFTNFDYREWQ